MYEDLEKIKDLLMYKAFDDLGLRQQRFAGLVLSILILEDILAIVLMVMLSTMAVSQNFEGSEMVYSIAKLLFFLILWFVVGIYIIPTFLKRSRKWMANETLLIVSLALCFGMVVVAALQGSVDCAGLIKIDPDDQEASWIQIIYSVCIFMFMVFMLASGSIIFVKIYNDAFEERERYAILDKIGVGSRTVKKEIACELRFAYLSPFLVMAISSYFSVKVLGNMMRT